jgi:type IV pilus assembly protein PilE
VKSFAKPGFTLVELLIVIVIIGILAMIAIPEFQDVKGKANTAVMKTDLRGLSNSEEGYLFDNDTYSSSLAALNYTASPGVSVTVNVATASGWSASAANPQSFSTICAIFRGDVPPLAPATIEGVIGCK